MVFLVMTRRGFESFCQLSRGSSESLWISGGILTPEELSRLRAQGVDVTNFSSEIHPRELAALADAISTIREHHPNESLWIEG